MILTTRRFPLHSTAAFSLLLFSFTSTAFATSTYQVTIDTSGLSGTNGDLLFEFAYGGTSSGNTISVLDFATDGTFASPLNTMGTETGTLPSGITLGVDSVNTLSQYLTGFDYANQISFMLAATANGPVSGSADNLSVFLLASDGVTSLITTRDPVAGTALMTLDITGSAQGFPSTYGIFTPDGVGTTMIYTTPEPYPGSLLAISLGGLVFIRPKFRGARQTRRSLLI